MLGIELSLPLPVVALVSHYLTNKLIGPRPLSKRIASLPLRLASSGAIEYYPPFRMAMLISEVRTKALLTRSPLPFILLAKNERSYDLHALSTPPAFILDQDQILN